MATTIYGNVTNHWRAWFAYDLTETDTEVVIDVTGAGMQSVGYGFQITYNTITTTLSCTGQSSMTASGNFYSPNGTTVSTSYLTATYTIPNTESSQSVTLSAKTTNASGFMNGTSIASTVIDIPALTSYTISYNANGGNGAPDSQTKYYGTDIVLVTSHQHFLNTKLFTFF